jgi:DNA polymerase-4
VASVTPSPRILLADCDQMFVAVARLVDPDGAGRAPLLVVGGTATSRGVVCSASYEVRAFGVRSGMAIAQAARRCPQAVFVPVPRKACGEKSREVRSRLDRWAPLVEAASIDEFYLDLSGTEALYRQEPLATTAGRIRDDLFAATGLRLSIGGGTNRLVAKLAAERAKPRPGTAGTGVLVVEPGGEAAFLATHQLAEIPGVGPRLQAKLRGYGLVSVADTLPVAERDLVGWLGPRTGRWLHERIRGRSGAGVEPAGEAKSVSREETFPVDLRGLDRLETELLRLIARVCEDIREDGLVARRITVKLRDDDFETRVASRTLPLPFNADRVAFAAARELLVKLHHRRPRPTRLLGFGLSHFGVAGAADQLSLLDEPSAALGQTSRDSAVVRARDEINRRFGRDAVAPARIAGRKPPPR